MTEDTGRNGFAEWGLCPQGRSPFSVETEKATVDEPNTCRRILGRIPVPAGETVPVGAVVALLLAEGESRQRLELRRTWLREGVPFEQTVAPRSEAGTGRDLERHGVPRCETIGKRPRARPARSGAAEPIAVSRGGCERYLVERGTGGMQVGAVGVVGDQGQPSMRR
jgi:pyruvate/2-oxoglutarate dehydrogenase complex dihydrolipoamide acyltransferase (E2) component